MRTGRPKKQQWEMKVPKTVALSQVAIDIGYSYVADGSHSSFSQFVEEAIMNYNKSKRK